MAFWRLRSVGYRVPDLGRLENRPTVVFVPGFMGSFLRDPQTGKRSFITFGQAVRNRGSLALDGDRLGLPPCPPLEAESVIGGISAFPFWVEVHDRFIRSLARSGLRVLPFPYDWRQDVETTAQKLRQVLTHCRQTGVQDLSVIGISLGGLITATALGQGRLPGEAPLARRAVFFTVPFRGFANLFPKLRFGWRVGGNRSLISGEVLSSFRSIYNLVPWGGRAGWAYHDPAVWQSRGWGLLASPCGPAERERRLLHVREGLARARRWKEALETSGPGCHSLCVLGVGRPTWGAGPLGEESVEAMGSTWTEEDGDGIVPVESAEAPSAWGPVERMTSREGDHRSLSVRPAIIQRIVAFLHGRPG